jgi:hypothetical protein
MHRLALLLVIGGCGGGCGDGSSRGLDGGNADHHFEPIAGCAFAPATVNRYRDWVAMWSDGSGLWIVGDGGGNTIGLRHDGTAWQALACSGLAPVIEVSDVFGTGPDDVWLLGDVPYHWDGVTLAAERALPAPSLRTASNFKGWAPSRNEQWIAVYGTGYEHWTMTGWQTTSTGTALGGFWGSAANRVFAISNAGLLEWEGGPSWTVFQDTRGATSIFGLASTHWLYMTLQGSSTATLYAWDTNPPRSAPAVDALGLTDARAVWASSATDVWIAAGTDVVRYDGATAARAVTGITGFTAFTVQGRSDHDVWIGGASGALVHWDGATFSSYW